jgi:hypothetical protein
MTHTEHEEIVLNEWQHEALHQGIIHPTGTETG